jgi:hypothetical protein
LNGNTFSVGGRRAWWGVLALITGLGIVEIAGVALLAHAFLPTTFAVILDVIGAVFIVAVAFATASVTWRRHVVTEADVLLVLGYLAQIRVPSSAMSQVAPLPALTGRDADRTGPTLVDGVLNLVAAPGVGRVQVTVDPPVKGRRLWQRREVVTVEVSDESGDLAALLRDRLSG